MKGKLRELVPQPNILAKEMSELLAHNFGLGIADCQRIHF